MQIIKITKQIRKCIWVTIKCEYCEKTTENVSGFNDKEFFESTIPNKKCPNCKKATKNKTVFNKNTDRIKYIQSLLT